ncbi:hypothetical protein GCM10027427_00040 [Pseudoclavibacter terrae]
MAAPESPRELEPPLLEVLGVQLGGVGGVAQAAQVLADHLAGSRQLTVDGPRDGLRLGSRLRVRDPRADGGHEAAPASCCDRWLASAIVSA